MSFKFSLFHYLEDSSNILMLCSYKSYGKINKGTNGFFDSSSANWIGLSFDGIWKLINIRKCLKFLIGIYFFFFNILYKILPKLLCDGD